MSLFKRKSRRSATITVSDHTRSSRGSLSSTDGTVKTSSHGSTQSLKTAVAPKIGSVASVKSDSKIKHIGFSDDIKKNGIGKTQSVFNNGVNPRDDEYLGTDQSRNMAFLKQPGENLIQEPDAQATGAPMELYASVIKGNKAELKKIITGNLDLLNTADSFGRTPLMYCVLADQLECAKYLISMGCDLDQVDNAGRSATHSAAHKGSYKFLELLHNRGASLNIKDGDGQTPLHLATRIRTPKCLEYILRNLGPGMVDIPDNQMRTALHWTAAFNNTECVKLLIKYGINIALTDAECKTPLHWAANNHDPSTVHTMQAILEKSPSVLNWPDNEGRTALHYAVAHGNGAAVEFLLGFTSEDYSDSCDRDRSDFAHRTPLHWAAQLGHIHVVKLLLKGNAKISSSDGNGATPFLYAALTDKQAVVEAMIEHDPTVLEQADIEGRNALMWAAGKGANNVIRTLLRINDTSASEQTEEGNSENKIAEENDIKKTIDFTPVDVNKLDNKGNTALHAAARNGHGGSVEILLKHGAKHGHANTDSHHTAIFGACEKGHVNCVTYLLDYKARVDIVDSENRNPLHWAALGGHAEVCDLLLKEGLDVDVRDKLERTPLHCAAFGGFINCMNLLLENGANVDAQDREGHSALHWAAQSGHLDAIKLLFQYNVFPNPMEYTEERLTPLDHALQKENEDVMQYLIEQGALSAEHIRNIAAMRIQAYFRGYKVRRTKEILMRTLALRKEKRKQTEAKENTAATKIQAYYRGYYVRRHLVHPAENALPESTLADENKKTNMKLAAIKIQAYYRGYCVRKKNLHGKLALKDGEQDKIGTSCDIRSEDGDDALHDDDDQDGESKKKTNSSQVEVDSGSHSPEIDTPSPHAHIQMEPAEDVNIFSNDEGVICDQGSTSSCHSHSSIKYKTTEVKKCIVVPALQSDEECQESHEQLETNDVRSMSPDISRSSALPAGTVSGKTSESTRHPSLVNSHEPTSEQFTASTMHSVNGQKIQKRKTRKTRSKQSTRHEPPESDSTKNHSSSRRLSTTSTSSSSTNFSRINLSQYKDSSRKNGLSISSCKRIQPTPPAKPKEIRTRKKRLITPRVDNRKNQYPQLDELGDSDNIHIEQVTGVARRADNFHEYYMDEIKLVPVLPITTHSDALDLSEYIESLMAMSPDQRKVLRDHQDERRKAFKAANEAASIIQKSWVRHLRMQNPSLHKKFLTARKRGHRKKRITLNTSPDIDPDSQIKETVCQPPEYSADQTSGIIQPSETSQASAQQIDAMRSSTVSFGNTSNNSRKSFPLKRSKPTNFGATFISLEKLEELSKIYGNPKMMRDLLANAGRSNTSLPSINSSSTKMSAEVKRPYTAADSPRQAFEKSLRGTSAYVQPSSAVNAPRPWVGLPSVTGRSRVASLNAARVPQRSKSGRTKSSVDYRLMPLQWQKLYGELQSATAMDEKRKTATRFSYNIGDIR